MQKDHTCFQGRKSHPTGNYHIYMWFWWSLTLQEALAHGSGEVLPCGKLLHVVLVKSYLAGSSCTWFQWSLTLQEALVCGFGEVLPCRKLSHMVLVKSTLQEALACGSSEVLPCRKLLHIVPVKSYLVGSSRTWFWWSLTLQEALTCGSGEVLPCRKLSKLSHMVPVKSYLAGSSRTWFRWSWSYTRTWPRPRPGCTSRHARTGSNYTHLKYVTSIVERWNIRSTKFTLFLVMIK